MKKLLLMLFSFGLALGAMAQVHGRGGAGGYRYSAPRITYVVPRSAGIGIYSPLYPAFGLGYGYGLGYPYFGYPSMYRTSRPSKLDLQIEDIKNDYKDRIWSAKHDTGLSRRERRANVQALKHERDAAIIDAKKNYYHTDRRS